MAKSILTVPSRSYQPGTRTVNLPNLSTDDNGIKISMTRENWPEGADIITGNIEGSNDGVEWFNLAPFSFDGGVQINHRTGQVVAASVTEVSWPETYDPQGNATPKRPAQVHASITNTVTLTTGITLEGS